MNAPLPGRAGRTGCIIKGWTLLPQPGQFRVTQDEKQELQER